MKLLANCIIQDCSGWWLCLRDDDGDIITLAGPYASAGEAGKHAAEEIDA